MTDCSKSSSASYNVDYEKYAENWPFKSKEKKETKNDLCPEKSEDH